jgi:hypothetical protein
MEGSSNIECDNNSSIIPDAPVSNSSDLSKNDTTDPNNNNKIMLIIVLVIVYYLQVE